MRKIIILLLWGWVAFIILNVTIHITRPLFVEYPKFEELEFIKGRLTKVSNNSKGKPCRFPIDVEMNKGKETIDVPCHVAKLLRNEIGGAIVIGIYIDKLFDNTILLDVNNNRQIWYFELNGKVLRDYESQLKRSESKTFSLIYLTFFLIGIFKTWKYRRQIR